MAINISQEARDRVIVALDFPMLAQAIEMTVQLNEHVDWFKIGLELVSAVGMPQAVEMVKRAGAKRIMLDVKLGDIPNTMMGTARVISRLGVDMFTVLASSGPESVRAAVENAGDAHVLAVTVLTSIDDDTCKSIYGNNCNETVLSLGGIAEEAGVYGLVCSPREIKEIKSNLDFKSLKLVTPGIRPRGTQKTPDDQARTMTPREAILAGSDYLVIGRPITAAPDPLEALEQIATRIDYALLKAR